MSIKKILRKVYWKVLNNEQRIRTMRKSGVKIGENCIIGLGSIVTKCIPSNSVAVGIPAKVIGTIDAPVRYNGNTASGHL